MTAAVQVPHLILSVAKAGPRSLLLFERIHYEWLHPRLIEFLREHCGTSVTLLTPKNAIAKKRRSLLRPEDRLVHIEDVDDIATNRILSVEAEASLAARNEAHYDLAYLRDLVQQDRWLSASFAGHGPNSYFAQIGGTPSIDAVTMRINRYFDWAERLFDERAIDCVVGWPSYSLLTTVITHVALKRGVPSTFLTAGRGSKSFRLIWSDGPYVGPRLLRAAMDRASIDPESPIPRPEPPSDTLAAIADLPREARLSTCLQRMFAVTRDATIWGIQDLVARRKSTRVPLTRHLKRIHRDLLMNRTVDRLASRDMAELTARPFLFFPLPYEPEYPNNSLARDFNDTLSLVKQTALATPAGMRLIVKEHVVGIGHRRRSFYEEIVALPNVRFAHNSIRGVDLVERCAAVVTLNGTAGLEAGYFGKRAVILNGNVEYAAMRHVIYAHDLRSLPSAMRRAIAPIDPDEQMQIWDDVRRHLKAITDQCVDVSDIDVFGGKVPFLPQAEYDRLFERFLDAFAFLRTS